MSLGFRDRRALLAGTVAIAALLLAARVIPTWRSYLRETRAELVAMQGELHEAEIQSQLTRVLRDSLEALAGAKRRRGYLLSRSLIFRHSTKLLSGMNRCGTSHRGF